VKPSKLFCLILTLMFLVIGCKKKPSATTTPLHQAVEAGDAERIQSLISSGADINAKDRSGRTPLHQAISRGHANVAELLIAKGGDVNAKTWSGNTPLHYAADGRENMTELLLANGANINAKNKDGGTPLHTATLRGNKDVAELLIANGADINAKDKDGRTPLFYAARHGYYNVVELLVAKGAIATATAKEDQPPEEHAVAAVVAAAQPNVRTLVQGNSAFAFDLCQKICSSEGNLFFSPYSISTALAMTYAGARGNTEKQMAETLRFSLDQENLHPAFAEMGAWLNQLQESGRIKLYIANSLWPQQDYKFLDEYLSLTKKYYGVSITPVDYKQASEREAARKTINKWVEERTEYKIKDLIAPKILDELTRLVLVDAIYFKGNWLNQFNPRLTKDAPFYISPKKSVQTPMMRQEQKLRYAELESLQIVELPYLGENLSMLVVLPREIDGLAQLEGSLSVENLVSWRESLNKKKVHIILPKFKITCQFILNDTLKTMGMVDAFILGKANFAGITGRPDLYISAVIHKAYVDVNEEGTEAAAATGVLMAPRRVPEPPTFRADHPFLFLIQDNHTGSILFIGRVIDPTKTGQ